MRKLCFIALLLFVAVKASFAQSPEDILRYSYFQQQGTARSIAIGGVMGSLGGDISAMYVNPAGLGMYKTQEIVISPGVAINNNKADFRGTNFQSNKTGFGLGTTGVVFGNGSPYSHNRSEAWGIAISQTANFNNTLSYKGQIDFSSFSEQFTEEAQRSGYGNVEDILNDPAYAFGTSLAFDTYLVTDTLLNGTNQYKGYPEFVLQNGGALNQERTVKTSGGIYEVALAYAANTNDKFYFGFTLGIPIVSYTRNTYFRESDPMNKSNNFNYSEWNDKLTTNGAGLNGKIGIIYKPAPQVRLGFTIHTPSFYVLNDRESANMVTDVDSGTVYRSNSTKFTSDGTGIGSTRYLANSPWKIIASASYVINEVSDVTKQRGFISADVEYNTYSSGSFADAESSSSDYYDALKSIIKATYKSAFNFRLGGELKFNTLMVRLGGAYYGNPYKNGDLKSNITQVGGGLGYRNKGIFIDLGYAYVINKNVDFPYRLQDKANTFAAYKNNQNNLLLTVGFKL